MIEAQDTQQTYVMRLFIADDERRSVLARENLERICRAHLRDKCKIEEVDVMKDFHAALEEHIYVAPALVLVAPGPRVTVYGTLNDTEQVMRALRLGASHA